ncbi:MAG: 3,4-dihydroxyphenylacetate 2,3-dioxygenase [Candidatus Carbobacillus sp.]|nr:3,4-dihydroxyphenylacetate 2,3-dioxygenase [Candidatus Carbobacillus sp.]
MFDIIRTARVVLGVRDLERSRHFYEDALGFVLTEKDDRHLYFRGLEERHHHSLVLKQAEEPYVEAIGFKVRSEDDLDALHRHFTDQGLRTRWLHEGTQRAVGRALRVEDPSGIIVEYFAQMERVERKLQNFDEYRGARMQRIDHFNCLVPDVQKAYDAYTQTLGFACSEYTTTKDGALWAAWLHRKPNVHDIAFMNSEGPRLHHIGFWAIDAMSIIHACDVLASLGYAQNIERGPGRHGLSNAFFLYLRDPDGHRIELYTGDYLTSDPDFEPIRWDIDDPRRQTFWGHAAPDVWFNEASSFKTLDGDGLVAKKPAKLEKLKPEFAI